MFDHLALAVSYTDRVYFCYFGFTFGSLVWFWFFETESLVVQVRVYSPHSSLCGLETCKGSLWKSFWGPKLQFLECRFKNTCCCAHPEKPQLSDKETQLSLGLHPSCVWPWWICTGPSLNSCLHSITTQKGGFCQVWSLRISWFSYRFLWSASSANCEIIISSSLNFEDKRVS